MRSSAGEHDRMPATNQRQVWIVPAPPEIIADLVMGGEHDPPREGRALLVCFTGAVEIDGHLLPVRLVLVHTGESGSPVVERVEVPVLAHDPIAITHDPRVVGRPIRLKMVVLEGEGSDGTATGNGPSKEQRDPAQGVDGPSREPDLRKSTSCSKPRSLRAEPAAQAIAARLGNGDPAERVAGTADVQTSTGELVEVKLTWTGNRDWSFSACSQRLQWRTYSSTPTGTKYSPWVSRTTGSKARSNSTSSWAANGRVSMLSPPR